MQTSVCCKKRKGPGKRRMFTLLLCFLLTSLYTLSQPLRFSFKNTPLEAALKEIEKTSGYTFIYTKEELLNSKAITRDIAGGSIEAVLNALFEDQPLSFVLNARYITLFKQPEKKAPVLPERITVQGRVLSEEGGPIAGATVNGQSSAASTTTDQRGAFLLHNVKPTDVLLISSIGFVTSAVPVENNLVHTIHLAYSNRLLEETVVKGYYSTSKRLNTGAVTKVTGEELVKQPVSNPLAGLAGRVPGLFIRQSNGLPGSNFTLLIRGQNSLRSGTAPLYIIDGIPFPVSGVSQRGAALNANNPFNTIAPSDIESIEILKDADAIAIYGSRGANGVILITTKKAKEGKSAVELNFYTGWGRITLSLDYLTTKDYLAMRREAFKNDGGVPTRANAPDLLAWDTTRYIDWKKLLIGGTSRLTNAQVRYSGGSAHTQFSLNTTFYRESTVYPGDFADSRATSELHVNHASPSGKFRAGFSTSYAYDQNNLLNQDLSAFINLPPNAPPPYDAEGKLNWSEGGVSYGNPLANLLKTYTGKSRRLTTSANLSYQPVPSLRFRISGGYNSFLFDETLLTPIASQNPALNPVGYASFGNNDFAGWILEPQVEYTIPLYKAGKLETLVGMTLQSNTSESVIIDASGYTDDALLHAIRGAASATADNSFSKYKYQAVYARANYTHARKYLVNLTGRRDGSSRFGPGKQFANFGAVGLGWIFTEEKALRTVLPFLSFGKLRGSYGTSGNDQIGDYGYLDTWSTAEYPYAGNPGLTPSRLFNPDYSWELNTKLNLGLESGLWNNRLLVTLDWYKNRSQNQLIPYSVPSQTGFTSLIKNFPGVVENKGIEVDISGTVWQRAQFRWVSSLNLTVARNKLVSFPGLETSSFANTYWVGKPINARIGYHYLGIDPTTGVYQFEDVNRDNRINTLDYAYYGTTNPTYYGGFQNTISYQAWTVQFLFQFTGQKGITPVWGSFQQVGNRNNQPQRVLDRWTKPNDVAQYQKYTQTFGSPATSAALLMSQSSASLTDASFVRLKNLYLSYALPQPILQKIGMQKAAFYLQAQNLLTFSRFIGADPENSNGLPPLQVVTLGASIQF